MNPFTYSYPVKVYFGEKAAEKNLAAKAIANSTVLTGGCAKNDGLKEAIEHVLKLKVVNLKTDPQLMGALGAAEYARQKGLAKK